MVGQTAVALEDELLLVPEGQTYLLSYHLDDEENKLWDAVQDGARAGREMMVTHTVKIKKEGTFFWRTLRKKVWKKFVVYNLFENVYSYGPNLQMSERTSRPDVMQQYIMEVVDASFIARHKLESGRMYKISIKVEVSERSDETGWQRFIPFKNLFKKNLVKSFEYVAP